MHNIYFNNNIIFKDKKILFEAPKILTFPGSTHTEDDVRALGGSVVMLNDGIYSGKTVGVFYQEYTHSTLDIPNGWQIATSVNARYYHVRNLTYTDACGYNFATYSNTDGIVAWSNLNYGYGWSTNDKGNYINCEQASSSLNPRNDYWCRYYTYDSPYTIRATYVGGWVLGTNSTQGHAGHEIEAFAAF